MFLSADQFSAMSPICMAHKTVQDCVPQLFVMCVKLGLQGKEQCVALGSAYTEVF